MVVWRFSEELSLAQTELPTPRLTAAMAEFATAASAGGSRRRPSANRRQAGTRPKRFPIDATAGKPLRAVAESR
jgi:hypothetical protein